MVTNSVPQLFPSTENINFADSTLLFCFRIFPLIQSCQIHNDFLDSITMSSQDQDEPMPSSDAGSSKSSPRRSRKLPMSPLYALCLWEAYIEHLPDVKSKPWRRTNGPAEGTGVQAIDSDVNGFIRGQKLQRHRLKVMPCQDDSVFPKCMGNNRIVTEYALFPQYGNLTNHYRGPTYQRGVLRRRRDELLRKQGGLYRPWIPGTKEWKEAFQSVEAIEEPKVDTDLEQMIVSGVDLMEELVKAFIEKPKDEPKDEIDELQEAVEMELAVQEEQKSLKRKSPE
jgi:hypothetical protein